MEGAARHAGLVSLGLLFALPTWAQAAPAPDAPAAPAAPAAPVIKVSSEGFSLSSPDKEFQLKLRGYLQADGRYFTSDADRPGATGFLVRRARPIVEGTLFGAVDFRLMPDFAGGTAVLFDAYLDLRPLRELKVRTGKFKPPVGLERLQSATAIPFIERALPTNLVPNRDVGVQLHGEVLGGVLAYAVGAFNGTPDGANVDTNLDDSFDLAGRVFAHPFRTGAVAQLKGLGLGFAASRGQQFGTVVNTGVAAFRTTGQQAFFSYRLGTTAADIVVANGEHLRLSPQGYFYYGPVGVLAEYVSSTQEVRRGDALARLRHHAWQATGSFVLGGNASYEGVKPEKPLKLSEGSYGAVELAARYSVLNIDPDAFPVFADPARSAREAKSWGLAANWYLNANVRISADYDHTHFAGGAANGSRVSESVFLSRFQVSW